MPIQPMPANAAAPSPARTGHHHWGQLAMGVICMVMIANLQYGWNLFVAPIDQKYHWGRATIQVAFTLFVLTETWLIPIEGWFVDKFGPSVVVFFGGVTVAIGWGINSIADSLPLLYIGAIVSGIGAGAVYGTCVGNALKWFADKRGLAAGITAAGFGAGAAATVVPIRAFMAEHGFQATFLWFGLGQGLVIIALSLFLRAPRPGEAPIPATIRNEQTRRQFFAREMLREPLFYWMYVTFVLIAAGGLMATAQIALIAMDFGVDKSPVNLLGIAGTTLTVALIINNITNGLARPVFGFVSDRFGRENTMVFAFTLEGISILALGYFGTTPIAFVLLCALVYFTYGEIFSLFPSMCTDMFGTRNAATNAGLLYTAKGTAALLVPLGNVLMTATGSWRAVFLTGCAMNMTAALLAIAVLKPMRKRHLARVAEAVRQQDLMLSLTTPPPAGAAVVTRAPAPAPAVVMAKAAQPSATAAKPVEPTPTPAAATPVVAEAAAAVAPAATTAAKPPETASTPAALVTAQPAQPPSVPITAASVELATAPSITAEPATTTPPGAPAAKPAAPDTAAKVAAAVTGN